MTKENKKGMSAEQVQDPAVKKQNEKKHMKNLLQIFIHWPLKVSDCTHVTPGLYVFKRDCVCVDLALAQ